MRSAIACRVAAGDVEPTVGALERAGTATRDISVLCPTGSAVEGGVRAGPSITRLAQATGLIVTGVGPCVVSGPVARMLVGTPEGRLVGGLQAAPGDLIRLMGISGENHALFDRHLCGGGGIILVHQTSPAQSAAVRSLLERLSGSGVHTAGQAAHAAGTPPTAGI